MKRLLILLFAITTLTCFGQLNESVSLRATGNINAVLKGLGANSIGAGLGLDVSFFSKHRLQALVETSTDRFMGDKMLVFDSATGKTGRTAVYSFKAGPQLFVTKNIALSATYGPSWYKVNDIDYSMRYGFKYSITGFLGAQRRFITKVFVINIPTAALNIQYAGFALGHRFR